MIPLLLMTTLLGTHRLDAEGLWYDEIWSVYVAGGVHFGSLDASQVLERIVFYDPTQGLGYPLLLAGWGSLVGWSEFGIRSLSLLAGVFAVAMTYRLGCASHSKQVGLYAALFLSVSAFFIWYTHEARTYSIVVLLAAVWVWSYQRLWFRAQSPSIALSLTFVLSGAGLLYANYYAVLLIAAAALFHGAILVMYSIRRTMPSKRWFYIIFLFSMMGIIFLPSLVGFMRGFGRFAGWDDVRARALSLPDLAFVIANYAGNSAIVLLLLFIIVGGMYGWRRGGQARLLLSISVMGWVLVFLLQARTNLIEFTKVRYVLVLWSPLAVLVGMGMFAIIEAFGQIRTRASFLKLGANQLKTIVGAGLPLLWLIGGINANLDSYFMTDKGWNGEIPRWRTLVTVLKSQGVTGDENDIFAYYAGDRAHDDAMSFEYSMHDIPMKSFITVSAFNPEYAEWLTERLQQARRVWYGMDWRLPFINQHEQFIERLHQLGYATCGLVVNQPGVMGMELYAKSRAYCLSDTPILQFGEGISLTGLDALPEIIQDKLTLTMGWALTPVIVPGQYVVGVHLFDADGNFVAQVDTGLNTAPMVMMQPTLDIQAQPPGRYTLRVLVYDWQTGTRLPGKNNITGESGDSVMIGEIQLQ
jgi:hypothetical protein